MSNIQEPKNLTDAVLIKRLEELSTNENQITVAVLVHLAEVDRRKLYLPLGYSSLFAYCTSSTGRLKYADTAALRRISCARAITRFPKLLDLLLNKDLSLTLLSSIAGVLNEANIEEVLQACMNKSSLEVKAYISRFKPVPEIKESVRAVTIGGAELSKKGAEIEEAQSKDSVGGLFSLAEAKTQADSTITALKSCDSSPERQPELLGSSPAAPRPAAEVRYELRFAVNGETFQALKEAQLILSSKFPRGPKLEDVLQEALEEFLDRRSAKRRAERRAQRKATKVREVKAPQLPQSPPVQQVQQAQEVQQKPEVATKAVSTSSSRHIPQAMKDRVLERADYRCEYTSQSGTRCDARHDLEVHHSTPFAICKSHNEDKLRLYCRAHNLYEACQDFGAEFMRSKVNGNQEPKTGTSG